MPLSKFLNNNNDKAPVISAGASSDYNPFAKLLEDNFMLNEKIQSNTLDFLSSETGVSNKPLQLDASKYADYNVYINDINSQSELDKERANNQSALEQLGNMTAQAVGSEVILGSLRGFSDIIDAGIELVTKDKDFTNPISQVLEEAQEAIREKFAIYQENPEDTWNLSDFGWWTSNAVSIASTLSLAIPSGVITKGVSLLGKTLNASNKLAKGLSLVSKVPNLRAKQISAITNLGMHAGLMRTAEGYIEARDVYKQTHDEILNKLGQMSEEDKAELIKRNPNFAGLDDEAIATKAAGDSADDTFKDDFWLMLLDAWQLKGLRNIGKGFRNVSTNATIREAQRKSINSLVGRPTEKINPFKQYISNLDGSSIKTFASQLSEGFEEGYQYIQQQESIDNARKIFDPDYKTRTYADFVNDLRMWEQAFWGWMGGIAFQGLGSATNAVAAKYISKNEDLLTRQRTSEIEGRISVLDKFSKDINLIRNNKNPYRPILGQDVNNQNEIEYEDITDEEKDYFIEAAFENLITDMTINATKKGNYDLLKEFFSSEEFQEHIDKLGVIETNEQKQYIADVVKHMDEVYDVFEGQVNHIISNDIVNRGTVEKIATDNTGLILASRSAQRKIDEYNNTINEARSRYSDNNSVLEIIDNADKSIKVGMAIAHIDQINDELAKNEAALRRKQKNRAAHRATINQLNKQKRSIYKALGLDENTTDSEFNVYIEDENNYSEQAINDIQYLDNETENALKQKANEEITKARFYDSNIVKTKNEIQSKAKRLENTFEAIRSASFNEALNQLDDVYENNDIDTVLDYIYGNKNANLTDEVKNKVDKAIGDIKVLNESDEPFADIIVRSAERKAKQKGARPVATVNGNPLNTPPTSARTVQDAPDQNNIDNQQEFNENPQNESGTSPSSTGGQTPQSLGLVARDEELNEDITQLNAQQRALEQIDRDDTGISLRNELIKLVKENAKNDDFKSLNRDEKINSFKEQLRQKGYSEEDINDNEKVISSWVTQIERNLTIHRSVINLDALTKEDIVLNSILGFEITDEFFEKAIAKFRAEHKVLAKGDKVYLSMISFLKYIADSNEIVTFEGLKAVYERFRDYIANNDKYKFEGNTRISDVNINNIIEGIGVAEIDVDNRIGILAEKDRENEQLFPIAIHELKNGDRLSVVVNKAGVEFYKEVQPTPSSLARPIKIAFNRFAEKSNYNNGYIVRIGTFRYRIWQNSDGNYHSDLDEIFNDILKDVDELTDEQFEFLEYLIDANKLTKENYINFWNNPVANKALTVLSDNRTNTNKTYDNAKELLKRLRNIYNYDANGDYFDKKMSLKNWTRKQYNNYKFTDSFRDGKIKEVEVKYHSEGFALTDKDNFINDAIVDFNLEDHHLGLVESESVKDVSKGDVRKAPGFRNMGMVVIIPNGSNAATYSRIKAQKIDYSQGFGKAVRDELFDIIKRHITGEDRFETTKEKLESICGVKHIIDEILCYEVNGKLFIRTIDDPVYRLIIYKKQADNANDSTGVTFNLGTNESTGVSTITFDDTTESYINQVLDSILKDTTYALSFDFANYEPINNRYVTKNDDRSLDITIGGQTYKYANYLDFLIKNKAAKIPLSKRNLGYGRETNFTTDENNYLSNINIRVIPIYEDSSSSSPRREGIDAIINAGTASNVSSKTIIDAVAPSFIENKVLQEEKFITDNMDVQLDSDKQPIDNGKKVKAEYNASTKRITLYKDFFDDAINDEQSAMRIIVHENVHRAIAEIKNPFKQEGFKEGLIEIRDAFLDALTTGTERNQQLIDYLTSINIKDTAPVIEELKLMFDGSKSEDYQLEEFLAESMTSKTLQGILNNIKSTTNVAVQTENLSLWQRIINAIRELFGFGAIKDNTLLAQEFNLFAEQIEKNKPANNAEETKADAEPTVNVQNIINNAAGSNVSNASSRKRRSRNFSSIDIDKVANINSVAANLSLTEQAKFEASVATGRIQMYCV